MRFTCENIQWICNRTSRDMSNVNSSSDTMTGYYSNIGLLSIHCKLLKCMPRLILYLPLRGMFYHANRSRRNSKQTTVCGQCDENVFSLSVNLHYSVNVGRYWAYYRPAIQDRVKRSCPHQTTIGANGN